MKKLVLVFIACLFLSDCSEIPEDPYLRIDPDFPLQSRSLVLPNTYRLFLDRSLTWGSFYTIDKLGLREGANSAELSVSFIGGCARHRWTLFAESTYNDRQDPDRPLDITLFLFHGNEQDDCTEDQSHTFRTIDLSFLAAGRYNITIENTSNRNQFFFQNYEVQ